MNYLKLQNPNADVFEIPPEFGAADDDNYRASIGDAVAKHVAQLSHKDRQVWEEYIYMGNGNIFRPLPNPSGTDKDPFNLKGKDLDETLKEFRDLGVSDKALSSIKEALQVEAERRETSEDAMDRGEIVGYDEWAENPQLWSAVDIPTSPKDIMLYQGNSSQAFYDAFPEGHPDSNLINQVIRLLDRDWCGNDDDCKYADWVINNRIAPAKARKYTKQYLELMINKLVEGVNDPEQVIEHFLGKIDSYWSANYLKASRARFARDNEMYNILVINYKIWNHKYKKGESVYSDIKKFGAEIFRDKELSRKMNPVTWSMYRKIRNKFAPSVMFKGADLNRCSVSELKRTLKVSDKQARDIWLSRPFDNLTAMKYKGKISSKAFALSEQGEQLLEKLEIVANKCIETGDIRRLAIAQLKMNQMQTAGKLTPDQWPLIWSFYKVCKGEILNSINERQTKQKEAK